MLKKLEELKNELSQVPPKATPSILAPRRSNRFLNRTLRPTRLRRALQGGTLFSRAKSEYVCVRYTVAGGEGDWGCAVKVGEDQGGAQGHRPSADGLQPDPEVEGAPRWFRAI